MQVSTGNSRLVKFFVAAAIFFAWGIIQGALQAQKPIHDFISLGPANIIVGTHAHIGLLGWVALALWGTIYHLLPQLGKPIAWPKLVDWIFWIFVIFLALNSIIMITVGIRAGNAFNSGVKGPQLDALMQPYMMTIGILSIILAIVGLLFVIQILVSAARKAPVKS
ncbi:MAG: cbb3-type cytochrome c oxidase subunit I [Candidatus Tectomicrobia bacterium]|uniref:Cbb3-type cytochrome c oxidase subunit I n=1 Tax=Tectimicrobiota bacterium TaxID=2528274 RepID=A0A933GQ79_UNCTE|nr:cbb3-type cytochrome c oxidase subunit I [Candidatus Tectomicrobia bacterium]